MLGDPRAGRPDLRCAEVRVARSALDLACTFFTLDEVRRVVDLLALYKVNVRYLHLTDDQSWRLPVGRPAESRLADDAFYSAEDLLTLAA